MDWSEYRTRTCDEPIRAASRARPAARRLVEYLSGPSGRELAARQRAADATRPGHGHHLPVHSDGRNVDRTLPLS